MCAWKIDVLRRMRNLIYISRFFRQNVCVCVCTVHMRHAVISLDESCVIRCERVTLHKLEIHELIVNNKPNGMRTNKSKLFK